MTALSSDRIVDLRKTFLAARAELQQALAEAASGEVTDYTFATLQGPATLSSLFGAKRDYIDEKKKKGSVVVDDDYIRESILQPIAKRHADFAKSEYAMPSYAGVVTDSQLESLVLYIKSLK